MDIKDIELTTLEFTSRNLGTLTGEDVQKMIQDKIKEAIAKSKKLKTKTNKKD
tara:strand:+ start:325 stop:483 length:159 start_codon:yes stop_codon:yes gene_type:complete